LAKADFPFITVKEKGKSFAASNQLNIKIETSEPMNMMQVQIFSPPLQFPSFTMNPTNQESTMWEAVVSLANLIKAQFGLALL
jgi:hypothetical protein